MHKTPLPEIPEYLYDERTLDLYWEVAYNENKFAPRRGYALYLRRKYIYKSVPQKATRSVVNRNKRWWNREPEFINEEYEVPEETGEALGSIMCHTLSERLDFTGEDVYKAAEVILQTLAKEHTTRRLLGKYPPKTLDIDPATI